MLFKKFIIALSLLSPLVAMAQEGFMPVSPEMETLAGPPAIFSLDNAIETSKPTDPLAVIPFNNVPVVEGDIGAVVDATPTEVDPLASLKDFLDEKPYAAKIALSNRRTNVIDKLDFNYIERQKNYKNLNITVAQCLKEHNGKFGNDIAFIEITDLEKNVLFTGWVFKKRPSVNVFEHPVYSLALLSCS